MQRLKLRTRKAQHRWAEHPLGDTHLPVVRTPAKLLPVPCSEPHERVPVWHAMRDPATLRKKAAETFRKAAFAKTRASAAKLEALARQLELWANDLEVQARAAAAYRHKAAEMRDQSKATRDPVAHQLLLILAAEYEQFAERAEIEAERKELEP